MHVPADADFKNAIADLNPEDIKTLTVLKGPNAAALYGARAAHGAIVITTKGGDKRQKGIGDYITFFHASLFCCYLAGVSKSFWTRGRGTVQLCRWQGCRCE